MKAVQYASFGGSELLDIVEIDRPVPGKGQVLVEVHAAGINPIDYKVRNGYLKQAVASHLPVTIGGDFSGVVTATGEEVSGFTAGDQVYGQAVVLGGGSGSCAEFALAKAASTAFKPKETDFVEAAALPLAGVSALQAVLDHLKLGRGQKILIHGGAGGIGSFAIQIAKAAGAYVATTVSGKDLNFVKELGADEPIDYRAVAFEHVVREFDAVLDLVGGETATKSFAVLKRGGIIVSLLGEPDKELADAKGIIVMGQMTVTDTARLTRLTGLVDSRKVKVFIDTVFPLSSVRDAFSHAEQDHLRGKVVVKIR